ncbi:hypothetical protein VTK26DRAFT_1436 [Humicola hyalothermophila]
MDEKGCLHGTQPLDEARKSIPPNIPGAWRGAGFVPFNLQKVIEKYAPKEPAKPAPFDPQDQSFTSFADSSFTSKIVSLIWGL